MEELEIIDSHECYWSSQHQAINILNYKDHGWTLFADHSKMSDNEDCNDFQYRLDITFCPFCGVKVGKIVPPPRPEDLPPLSEDEYNHYKNL